MGDLLHIVLRELEMMEKPYAWHPILQMNWSMFNTLMQQMNNF